MEKVKTNKSYIGNLFIIKDGIGEVTSEKYVVIRDKVNKKFIAYPGEKEVFLGLCELTAEDENIPVLINAKNLSTETNQKYVDDSDIGIILKKVNK